MIIDWKNFSSKQKRDIQLACKTQEVVISNFPVKEDEVLSTCFPQSLVYSKIFLRINMKYERANQKVRLHFVVSPSGEYPCCLFGQRFLLELNSTEGAKDLHFSFLCHENSEVNPVESMLVIDLGNTRSCALVCYDIKDTEKRGQTIMYRLPFHDYTVGQQLKGGVFDSIVALSSKVGFSFTRVGAEAFTVIRRLNGSTGGGNVSLSSPKRYFWDADKYGNGWRIESIDDFIPSAMIDFAELWHIDGINASMLPRAAILSSMLLEFLEQAEMFINGDEHFQSNSLPKVISHVCVTYPSAWSEMERKLYQKVLQTALDVYTKHKCHLQRKQKISLDVSCDEGTAVLLCYLYGEIVKCSGYIDFWLESVGRTSRTNSKIKALRVAVIDVGGGTSDLVIANVEGKVSQGTPGIDIKRLYKDGVNKAGDLLLHKIVEKVLIDKVSILFITDNASKQTQKEFYAKFRERLNNSLDNPDIRALARSFWFPLAIKCIECMCKEKSSSATTVYEIDFANLYKGGAETIGNLVKANEKEWTNENTPDFSSESFQWKISLSQDDFKTIENCIVSIFRPTARLFGNAIFAFDADMVILAGKTSEIPAVQNIFKEYCMLPDDRFIPMWNYHIGDWCSIANNGHIRDSKFTTAIGAAVFSSINNNFRLLKTESFISTDNAAGLNAANSYWGIANNGNFFIDDAILTPQKNETTISYRGGTKIIARRRFPVDSTEVALSYELRMKPLDMLLDEWKKQRVTFTEKNKKIKIEFKDMNAWAENEYFISDSCNKTFKETVNLQILPDPSDDSHNALLINVVSGQYEDDSPIDPGTLSICKKPMLRELQSTVSVKVKCLVDESSHAQLVIDSVDGKYADGSLVKVSDMDLRIRTSEDEAFWLDSGKI